MALLLAVLFRSAGAGEGVQLQVFVVPTDVEPTPTEGAVSVEVVDDDGLWQGLAEVTLHPLNGPPLTAVSDYNGPVVFVDVPPGTWVARAQLAGYATTEATTTVRGGHWSGVGLSMVPLVEPTIVFSPPPPDGRALEVRPRHRQMPEEPDRAWVGIVQLRSSSPEGFDRAVVRCRGYRAKAVAAAGEVTLVGAPLYRGCTLVVWTDCGREDTWIWPPLYDERSVGACGTSPRRSRPAP